MLEGSGYIASSRKLNRKEQLLYLRKHITSFLQKKYRSLSTGEPPWMKKWNFPMEQYFTSLHLIKQEENGDEAHVANIGDILKPQKKKPLHSILIEGNCGYGKTTLGKKLAWDWASDMNSTLKKYDIVVYLKLQCFKSSFRSFISQEVNLKDVSSDDIIAAMELNPEKILFILDGYNEFPHTQRNEEVLSVWNHIQFPSATVVITSRMEQATDIKNSADRYIVIKGFTKENRIEFIKRYFHETSPSNDITKVLINFLDFYDAENLFVCPLLLTLLCQIASQQQFNIPENKTELMQDFLDFIVKGSLIKCSNQKAEVDLFGRRGEEMPSQCVDLLKNFGRIALKALKESRTRFTAEEILTVCCGDSLIFNLGFLFKNSTTQETYNWQPVQCIHQVFLEFAASFHLHDLFIIDKGTFEDQARDLVEQKPSSPVLCFLVGLLGKKAHQFFNYMKQWKPSKLHLLLDLVLASHDPIQFIKEMENPKLPSLNCSVLHQPLKCTVSLQNNYFNRKIDKDQFLDFLITKNIAEHLEISYNGQSEIKDKNLTHSPFLTTVSKKLILHLEDFLNNPEDIFHVLTQLQPNAVQFRCCCKMDGIMYNKNDSQFIFLMEMVSYALECVLRSNINVDSLEFHSCLLTVSHKNLICNIALDYSIRKLSFEKCQVLTLQEVISKQNSNTNTIRRMICGQSNVACAGKFTFFYEIFHILSDPKCQLEILIIVAVPLNDKTVKTLWKHASKCPTLDRLVLNPLTELKLNLLKLCENESKYWEELKFYNFSLIHPDKADPNSLNINSVTLSNCQMDSLATVRFLISSGVKDVHIIQNTNNISVAESF